MILRRKIGSCVLKVSGVKSQLILSIDTLDQHPDWNSIDSLIDTRSTLDQHLVNSWSIVWQAVIKSHALIEGYMLLVDSRLIVDRDVDGMLIKCQPKVLMKCQLNIDQLLIECTDQEYL